MKTAFDNYASQFSIDGGSLTEPSGSPLLGRIGDDLRCLYDETIDSEMPRHLLDLAAAIDARRMEQSGRD